MNTRRYYVYQHLEGDTPVYTGKGSHDRVWSLSSRSAAHKAWMIERMPSAFKWRILKEGLTDKEAFALENETLSKDDFKFNKHCKSRWYKPPSWPCRTVREVLNRETGEVFISIVAAAKSVGVHPNTVANAIKGKKWQNKAGGYTWSYNGPRKLPASTDL